MGHVFLCLPACPSRSGFVYLKGYIERYISVNPDSYPMSNRQLLAVRLSLCLILWVAGAVLQAQSVSGVINSYHKVTAIAHSTATLTVTSSAGLSPGTRVLLIQMKGAAINTTNSNLFGTITAMNSAGLYEWNTVCSVAGNTVLLKYGLVNTYDASGFLQLVAIPQYVSVTVSDTLTAPAWDPVSGTGGVLVLEASDTVFLNAPVSVTGKGFTGGPIQNYPLPTYDCIWSTNVTNYFLSLPPSPNLYYTGGLKGEGIAATPAGMEYGRGRLSNAGGGGNNHNTGGGGGANYGAGGNGGNRSNESLASCHGTNPGIGGVTLSLAGYSAGNNRIFLGGGGGSGHMNNNKGIPGGNGGGICIIRANVLMSSGQSILANGQRPFNVLCSTDNFHAEGDGGGGGGAGGTVLLSINQLNGTCTVEANGTDGSNSSHKTTTAVNDCTGPGGGGGGGVVWLKAASQPLGLTVSVNGGNNGIVSMLSAIVACRGSANGATSGSAGALLFNHVPVQGSTIGCVPLTTAGIVRFTVTPQGATNHLNWQLQLTETVSELSIERSADQLNRQTIYTQQGVQSGSYSFSDRLPGQQSFYYRIQYTTVTGKRVYSAWILARRSAILPGADLKLMPNPAKGTAWVTGYADVAQPVQLLVYDQQGRLLHRQQNHLRKGMNRLALNHPQLPEGTYILCIRGEAIISQFKMVVGK